MPSINMTPPVKCLLFAFFFLLLLTAPCCLFADTVELKNGNLFEGDVVLEESDAITLQLHTGQIRIAKSDIVRIVEAPFTRLPPYDPDAGKSDFEKSLRKKWKEIARWWQELSDEEKIKYVDRTRFGGAIILIILLIIRSLTTKRPKYFGRPPK